jgi:oligopeptide transport system substrate-binding protein
VTTATGWTVPEAESGVCKMGSATKTKRFFVVVCVAVGAAFLAAGCGGGEEGTGDRGGGGNLTASQVITVNWGAEPPSLDPGLATDTTSANILLNIMDPLVKLDEDLNPVPSLAESWDVSDDGKTVTFHLREGATWTNGDPVTAGDFEYSWKRTISPELAADYAYQFGGIVGADAYTSCKKNCAPLRDKVGVRAVDARTLEVKLTTAQPWFIQQVAHHSFLAVHRPTVERFGDNWTEARNIVTNGPFRLDRWQHDARIDLVKWDGWRDADSVTLERVDGRMITDGTTAVQAFEAGELDATTSLPPEELPRLKNLPEYQQYAALGTYYYGVNVENITDVNQRRAMALAIDRRSIIDNIAQADQLPATGFTPQGMPGFEEIGPTSKWLPEEGDMEEAKDLMSQVPNPKRDVTLFLNDAPGHRAIAVAVQDMWKELGLNVTIKVQEWAQFLEFLGPPPNRAVDAYRLGWVADFTDAINFLELWTCRSGNNNTNFCNQRYDQLVSEARRTADDADRYNIYGQLEEIMFGEDGEVPIIPIYWYTYTELEKESIKDTFNINPLDQIDLTRVQVVEG